MNIAPINSTSASGNLNFSGKLIRKGFGWTPSLEGAFFNYNELKELTKGYDVVGRVSAKKVHDFWDSNHYMGQPVYKLNITLRKENSIKDKIKDFFGLLPKFSLTQNYHAEQSLIYHMDEEYFEKLKSKINKQF